MHQKNYSATSRRNSANIKNTLWSLRTISCECSVLQAPQTSQIESRRAPRPRTSHCTPATCACPNPWKWLNQATQRRTAPQNQSYTSQFKWMLANKRVFFTSKRKLTRRPSWTCSSIVKATLASSISTSSFGSSATAAQARSSWYSTDQRESDLPWSSSRWEQYKAATATPGR